MFLVGLALLLLGVFLAIKVLYVLGIILLVVGGVLFIHNSMTGSGRRLY